MEIIRNPIDYFDIWLKVKWRNYCALVLNGTSNTDADRDIIIFAKKDTKLYVPVFILSAEDNEKLSKPFRKGLKDQCIVINIKEKVRIKYGKWL